MKYYNFPIIGITGTNGKTSTAHFCAQLLQKQGKKIGMLGTLGNGIYDCNGAHLQTSPLTTLGNKQLIEYMHYFEQQNIDLLIMEVSSHGIDQNRIKDIPFTIKVLTNIGSDHLDYHPSLAHYRTTKHHFFTGFPNSDATWIINADDPEQKSLYTANLLRYSVQRPADYCITNIQSNHFDFRCTIQSPNNTWPVNIPLIGEFQLANILAAFTVCAQFVDANALIPHIESIKPIEGRMHIVASQPTVIVDYAHTEDALYHALVPLRKNCKNDLWCVFGCGGERDQSKRKKMGEVAASLTDYCIITDDNPRHEDPAHIREMIIQGCPQAIVIADRGAAITHAITHAQKTDCILIAGKGHEAYQIIGDQRLPFSDIALAQQLTAAHRPTCSSTNSQ